MASHAHQIKGEAHPLKRVVVVDDNEILLRAWKRILSRQACVYFTTNNPEEALEHLQKEGADLLICDIVMPRMDGFDLLQRTQELSHKPRVVLTTGYVCDFTRLKLEVGSEDVHVLMKPYNDIHEIGIFVRRLLDGDNSLDQEEACRSLDDARVHLWSL